MQAIKAWLNHRKPWQWFVIIYLVAVVVYAVVVGGLHGLVMSIH